MGTARSHLDLCTFVQILEVDERNIPDTLIPILRTRDTRAIAEHIVSLGANARSLFVDERTNLHESLHIVQAITYPFLHWYATLAFKQAIDTFTYLERLAELDLGGRPFIPTFHLLEQRYSLFDTSKRFLWMTYDHSIAIGGTKEKERPTRGRHVLDFSAIDLIENAASVMQYQFSTGKDIPSWLEFERWSKRNPSYTSIIEFVGEYIGDQDVAIRAFGSMIQTCFETNKPCRAFAILVAALKIQLRKGILREFVSQSGPIRWIDLFDLYLSKKFDAPPDYGDLLSEGFYRLEFDVVGGLRLGGRLLHPIVGRLSEQWSTLRKSDSSYRYAFLYPNGYQKQISRISSVFTSPITLLKFSFDGETMVVVAGDLGDAGLSHAVETATETDIKAVLVEFLLMFGAARQYSGSWMSDDFRLCHHSKCPHYQTNYCNLWIFVPREFADCTFPARFNEVLARTRDRRPEPAPTIRIFDQDEIGRLRP